MNVYIVIKSIILLLVCINAFSLYAGDIEEERSLDSEIREEIYSEVNLEILAAQIRDFAYFEKMTGDVTYLSGLDGEMIYARQKLGIRDIKVLMKKIEYAGKGDLYRNEPNEVWCGTGYKKIGEDYSQAGGVFIIKIDFDEFSEGSDLNCFAYALGTFGERLEILAQKSMNEIQESVSSSIDLVVEHYFENVRDEPEDGDLVIYKSSGYYMEGQFFQGTTHAGVYRKLDDGLNERGAVESKWGWMLNPYVFVHDVFFVPSFYGETVQFYRLKNGLCS